MKLLTRFALLAWLFGIDAASAEIRDASAGGFTSSNELTIAASREDVWRAAVRDIGAWWNADHTLSGESSRLSIAAKPQGCFCENFGNDAGVVHLTVTMVSPGILLRMTGGLGPLGLMGVNGNLIWEFADEGEATRVKFTYAVGGYRDGGLDALAAPVDSVVGEALQRLRAYVETGDADHVSGE